MPPGTDLVDPIQPERVGKGSKPELLGLLEEIFDKRLLVAHFQPILDLGSGEVIGFEGLIRGPDDTPLRAPVELFRFATRYGRSQASSKAHRWEQHVRRASQAGA